MSERRRLSSHEQPSGVSLLVLRVLQRSRGSWVPVTTVARKTPHDSEDVLEAANELVARGMAKVRPRRPGSSAMMVRSLVKIEDDWIGCGVCGGTLGDRAAICASCLELDPDTRERQEPGSETQKRLLIERIASGRPPWLGYIEEACFEVPCEAV